MREAPVTARDPVVLEAGALRAVVHPSLGMLVSSFARGGVEVLRLADDVASAAATDALVGLPLLHPWANRLDGLRYAACGRSVVLPAEAPLLRYDDNGLPNHGVAWSRLPWTVTARAPDAIDARLDWRRPDWLAVFPYPHRLAMRVALDVSCGRLVVDTTLHAGDGGAVPVCFGFHPYLGLPDAPRDAWRLRTPPLRRLDTDARLVPTGAERAFAGFDVPLAALDLDTGYRLEGDTATVTLATGALSLHVELLEGFRVLQFYAPRGHDYICIEPMTAPANALVRGEGLIRVPVGGTYRTRFALRLEAPAA